MRHFFITLTLYCFTGGFLFGAWAQSMDPNKNSVVTKSVRPIGNFPVVYQHEINGGIHQYKGTPWLGDDAVGVTLERVRLGMLATNTNDKKTYRYIGTAFDAFDVATSNAASDWEQVLLITTYQNTNTYPQGAIVINNGALFEANTPITGNAGNAITDAAWDALQTDDQNIANLGLAGTTLTVGIENGTSQTVNLNSLQETVTTEVNGSVTTTVTSTGENIILTSGAYTLPAANTVSGKTYTIKNTNTSTNTSEIVITGNIDGNATTTLWRRYDYITVISDGSNWYKVAEGGTEVAQGTSDINSTNTEHDDAFYWGNPDTNNSWRIVFDNSNNVLVIQRREANVWVNKTSIIP